MFGFTDNYIKVKTAFDAQRINKIQRGKLEEINAEGTVEMSPTVVPVT